ncbi:E3 ubiquitin-protein ligase TRIM21-like isoform X1 [Hippoglossus stenolepis]|uniref:E3 ubiquitin-protein ligase TRIM21-like isoform X1 n=1 Tax=Hippoglossus stenolepis TaxID=195615 RepID=UPI001FAF837C|nr:E3 ubiquitin-protein ligase TRIM21-like isoform X1 [Hippoglossus stenolepis]
MDFFPWSADSDMMLQVCECGWSKVTTYQGLRIHQGKMGCTVKGVRIPERSYSPLIPFTGRPIQLNEPNEPVMTSIESADSDESLQVCKCGWSKVTTNQGLRIHQGKRGCTVKGVRVPERRNSPLIPSTGRPTQLNEPENFIPPPIKHSPQTLNGHIHPAAADVTADETSEPFFQTPERPHHQTATNTDKARRALDFSTGAEQVQAQMFDLLEVHAWEQMQFHPANQITTPPTTTVSPREDEEEKQREAEKLLMKAKQDNTRAELQQRIQIRELKMAEVKLSVKGLKVSLDTEWLEINNVFSKVMKVVEDARQKALQPLEERRQSVKREAKDLLQGLERETDELQKTIAELDGNPDLQISQDELTDWDNTSVDTSFSFGSLRTTTSAMMEQIQLQIEELSSVELKRIPTYAVDVKLDPATAHPFLTLSDGGKKVRDGGRNQEVPDTPQRFDMFGSVLGLNGLTSGRSYWEVEVGNKTGWDLGVARGDANRKGKLSLNPDNGYWATVHYEDKGYAALTAPRVSLPLTEKPQKVGVFVDYEEGLVSFYDTTARSHIYSFTECSFGGEIFPYFSPHLEQNGQNAAPLIISSVERQ